jgi:hypothetical protein
MAALVDPLSKVLTHSLILPCGLAGLRLEIRNLSRTEDKEWSPLDALRLGSRWRL